MGAVILNERTKKYLILSLKYSPGRFGAIWWRPEGCGYTEDINKAGRYSEYEVFENETRLNNGKTTIAILESNVVKMSEEMRIINYHELLLKYGK